MPFKYMESVNGSVDRVGESLYPVRPKPRDLVMTSHVTTQVSSVQDEAAR